MRYAIGLEETGVGTEQGRSEYRAFDSDGKEMGFFVLIPVGEFEGMCAVAKGVVDSWEHGDLAGAVNELRVEFGIPLEEDGEEDADE